MQAYCVKCRAKREMKDTKAITMKNGKSATQNVCPKQLVDITSATISQLRR